MWQQTHIFAGLQVAERYLWVMPEDSVVMEIGTNNNPVFTKRLLKKYQRIVAYTFLIIHSRDGNRIDARNDTSESPIIWVHGREQLLKQIIYSSNAIYVFDQEEGDSVVWQDTPCRSLESVIEEIQRRIADSLLSIREIILDNWCASEKVRKNYRLDRYFTGFPDTDV